MQTPVNSVRLGELLKDAGFCEEKTNYLMEGYAHGFALGHRGLLNSRVVKNHVSSEELTPLVEKVQKEVEMGHIAGPFSYEELCKLFPEFQISPLNLRPKKEAGQYRLIFDLSHPRDGSSINENIPDVFKHVKYSSVGHFIRKIMILGPGAYLAKCDIKHAFRIVPMHPTEYRKLCMAIGDEYFFDKRLPMGVASSCGIWESSAEALIYLHEKSKPKNSVSDHLMDDFIFAEASKEGCNKALQNFLSICEYTGFPIAPEKTVGPTQCIIYLGIELDTVRQMARLPL